MSQQLPQQEETSRSSNKPELVAAPTAPAEEPVVAPVQEPASGCPTNGPAFQQAPQQAYQQPTQAAYQQVLPRPTRTTYPAQPSQFGVAVGVTGIGSFSALKRPTAVENPKALNGEAHENEPRLAVPSLSR